MNTNLRRALIAAASVSTFALAACGGSQSGSMPHDSASPMSHSSQGGSASVDHADLMFVTMMIPHHQQAVAMSDLILAKSGIDQDVRKLAEQIKAAQQPEIDQMKSWLAAWGVDETTIEKMMTAAPQPSAHAGHGGMAASPQSSGRSSGAGMTGMLSEAEMAKLTAVSGATAQKLYLQGMIAHHEGAIVMAKQVKASGKDPRVQQLADNVISTQQAEIEKMQQLLAG